MNIRRIGLDLAKPEGALGDSRNAPNGGRTHPAEPASRFRPVIALSSPLFSLSYPAFPHTDLSHLILSKCKYARRYGQGVSIRVFRRSGISHLWGKPDLSWDVR